MTVPSIRTSYPMLSSGFMSSYWITMRPYLMFVSGITGLAGASLAAPLRPGSALLIGAASFFSYGFGQALTDCFQTDTDALSAPYRPLTRGIVRRGDVLAVSLAGLLACAAVFALFQPLNLVLGLFAVLGLATYTPFKRRWWGGPFYNAWIVSVLFVIGYVAGSGTVKAVPRGFLWLLGCVFFSYATFVLIGYFKDVTADGATGYQTLPVRFGRKPAALVSAGLIAAGIACYLFSFFTLADTAVPLYAVVAGGAFGVAGIGTALGAGAFIYNNRSDNDAHLAIALTVHSYILLLSSVIVLKEPLWTLPVLIFYSAFILTLHARPAENQI